MKSIVSLGLLLVSGIQAWAAAPVELPTEVLADGFKAETIYKVDLDSQGSWVALTVDGKGRLIASDRRGPLYRITVPPLDDPNAEAQVERLEVPVGMANGLLEAFGSLYVMGKSPEKSGLFRLTDTNGDDHYDQVEHLISLNVGADHHAHAILLSPDGKRLVTLSGNNTDFPDDIAVSNMTSQDEDHLLPRSTYYGHNTNRMAPGGFVLSCLPDGSDRRIHCAGFRNPYDIAFNKDGELFAFDADMEYDVGAPWYRPTRVNHAVSGGDFGWRFGAGKWPTWFPDTVGSVVDIGRGSPTGVVFGYGAKFPEKYQKALFVQDWTYGKIYAVHMEEDGATYSGSFETFLSGRPLPVSDIVIRPQDGAMYFVAGGRRTQSSVVRVSYVGDASVAPIDMTPEVSDPIATRRELEALHGRPSEGAVEKAWPYLASDDRAIRYAARVAVETQPTSRWAERAKSETHPIAAIEAGVALARMGDARHKSELLGNLNNVLEQFDSLSLEHRLDLIRAYDLVFIRMGAPNAATREKLIAMVSGAYPADEYSLNHELCQLALYLNTPDAVSKTVDLLLRANTQSDQMFYAYHLRTIADGWSDADLDAYFGWIQRANANQSDYTGGGHFANFLKMVQSEAMERLNPTERERVAALLESGPKPAPTPAAPREFVKNWTVDDLKPALARVETDRSFIRGKRLYDSLCATCHLFNGSGGAIGPDLTSVGAKLDYPALLTEIVQPSEVISEQHASVLLTLKDGSVIFGREVGGGDDSTLIATNPLDPNVTRSIDNADIEKREVSPVSMMPPGLINTLTQEEILDLMMYIASGGKIGHTAFQK